VNDNAPPSNDKLVADKARVSLFRRGKRGTLLAVMGVACVTLVSFVFVSQRHGKVASPSAPSARTPSPVPTLDYSPPEFEPLDAGGLTSSLDEALARALAWMPPVTRGAPSAGDRNAALAIKGDDHCLGSHEAKVTLMVFGDLNCPFTLRMFKMLRGWLDERPAAFRLVWRERPLDIHPSAAGAALATERVALRFGEPAFWRFICALSEFERTPSGSELQALELGLTEGHARVTEAAATTRASAKLERDRLVALTYAIHETPTIFVNGLRLEGEVSRIHLEQLVTEEQQEVEALLDESVPQGRLYTIRVDANLLDWVRE
jgi:protein-disulfide isomerase